jgi:hypothetical protein
MPAIIIMSIVALIVILGTWADSKPHKSVPLATRAYSAPTPEPVDQSHGAALKVGIYDGSYGLATLLNVRITNPNKDVALRDFVVECAFAGASRTIVRTDRRTVYELVQPHKTITVRRIPFGFIPLETGDRSYVNCRIVRAEATFAQQEPAPKPKKKTAAKPKSDKSPVR